MHQAVANPGVVSLAAGLVDPGSLPVGEVRQAAARLLGDDATARLALQYGTTAGEARLRQHLVAHLARLEGSSPGNLGVTSEQLVLTTGSQQFISLVAEVLLDPGDIVFVSSPTYFAYLGTLHGVGARVIPIPADEDGMQIDALTAEIERVASAGELDRVKLIYVVSDFENPSGRSLSTPRRRALVEIARRWSRQHRILILEDAAYRELRYDGPEHPSVFHFDTHRDTVILAQTFSKTFSPGLRVGYGVAPPEVVTALCERKGNEDFGSTNFSQHMLATVFDLGLYTEHVESVRTAYREKRDRLLAGLERHLGDMPGVSWVHPHGGLYVWLTLPESVPAGFDSPLFQRAVHEQQVMYVPGEFCYAGPVESRPRNQMRLSYGVLDADRLEDAAARLARAIRTELGCQHG